MFSVLLRWIPVERLCPTEVTSEPAIVFHNFIFCFFLRLHAQTNFISFTVIGPGNSRNVFLKGFQKEKKRRIFLSRFRPIFHSAKFSLLLRYLLRLRYAVGRFLAVYRRRGPEVSEFRSLRSNAASWPTGQSRRHRCARKTAVV